jgi:hypothetical protein
MEGFSLPLSTFAGRRPYKHQVSINLSVTKSPQHDGAFTHRDYGSSESRKGCRFVDPGVTEVLQRGSTSSGTRSIKWHFRCPSIRSPNLGKCRLRGRFGRVTSVTLPP